jgi:hypothetical protein
MNWKAVEFGIAESFPSSHLFQKKRLIKGNINPFDIAIYTLSLAFCKENYDKHIKILYQK